MKHSLALPVRIHLSQSVLLDHSNNSYPSSDIRHNNMLSALHLLNAHEALGSKNHYLSIFQIPKLRLKEVNPHDQDYLAS